MKMTYKNFSCSELVQSLKSLLPKAREFVVEEGEIRMDIDGLTTKKINELFKECPKCNEIDEVIGMVQYRPTDFTNPKIINSTNKKYDFYYCEKCDVAFE